MAGKKGKNTTLISQLDKVGGSLKREQKTRFGNLLDLRDQLLDPKSANAAAKDLGQRQLDAQRYQKISPKLREAFSDIVEGTALYNEDEAEYLQQVSKAGIRVRKAASKVDLANRDFNSQKHLLARGHAAEINYQRQVQEASLVELQISTALRSAFHHADAFARLEKLRLQPAQKQRLADKQYREELLNENLTWGNQANEGMVVGKNYKAVSGLPQLQIMPAISNLASKLGINLQ